MPTLFTDSRSGGVKKSSGVNVLPIVSETWAQIRDDKNTEVDYLIASFDGSSKTDITVVASGSGGVEACAAALLDDKPCYGGVRLRRNGRFVHSFMCLTDALLCKGEEHSVYTKLQHIYTQSMRNKYISAVNGVLASMYKNGVLNVLEGSDNEIDMRPGLTEDQC
ncbi:hypothetical protein QTG54_012400 [Skeletonema marinoi]|uniref:ADF-H domain-containing protein n=1 Tax=Skeletonema marinoi TaxID=267567 RepID=A0AAD8Y185_9STRA|nr:hypothetical protein QTG54_012400 [Skeletonema marinoi]